MPNPQNVIGKGHRFPKGVSGNPKGRPKLPDLKEAMAKLLSAEKGGKTTLDTILNGLKARAAKGDSRAAEVLFERGYGKVGQNINLLNNGGSFSNIINILPPAARCLY